jgi:hypothetical protein
MDLLLFISNSPSYDISIKKMKNTKQSTTTTGNNESMISKDSYCLGLVTSTNYKSSDCNKSFIVSVYTQQWEIIRANNTIDKNISNNIDNTSKYIDRYDLYLLKI